LRKGMVGWIVCGMKEVKDGELNFSIHSVVSTDLQAESTLAFENSLPRRHLPPYTYSYATTRIVQTAQINGLRRNLSVRSRRFHEIGRSDSTSKSPFFFNYNSYPNGDD